MTQWSFCLVRSTINQSNKHHSTVKAEHSQAVLLGHQILKRESREEKQRVCKLNRLRCCEKTLIMSGKTFVFINCIYILANSTFYSWFYFYYQIPWFRPYFPHCGNHRSSSNHGYHLDTSGSFQSVGNFPKQKKTIRLQRLCYLKMGNQSYGT